MGSTSAATRPTDRTPNAWRVELRTSATSRGKRPPPPLRARRGPGRETRTPADHAVGMAVRRGTLAHETMRVSFLRDKTAAYEELLRLYLARGTREDSRRAFAIAERAKSRALVDLLTGVTVGSGATADDTLERRIRNLQ